MSKKYYCRSFIDADKALTKKEKIEAKLKRMDLFFQQIFRVGYFNDHIIPQVYTMSLIPLSRQCKTQFFVDIKNVSKCLHIVAKSMKQTWKTGSHNTEGVG